MYRITSLRKLLNIANKQHNGRCRCMKWQNIKSLLMLAKVNGRFTQEQADYLIKTFCRE
jgi:hypothetical protein